MEDNLTQDLGKFSKILERIYRCIYCCGTGTDMSCKDDFCYQNPCGSAEHMKLEPCKPCKTTGYSCGPETTALIKKYLPKEESMSNSH